MLDPRQEPTTSALPKILGIDPAPEALHLAQQRHTAPLLRAALPNLPFAPQSFELILCIDVLYHRAIPDPARALRALHDLLRPGGFLLLNVPAYPRLHAAHDQPIHTARRFTRPQLRALLQDAGLRPQRITHWNSLLLPAIIPHRLLSRGQQQSDLQHPPGRIQHHLATAALTLERQLLQHTNLPAGLSILATAHRPL